MADSEKPKHEGRPESPTTARELDFDDDEPGSHPQTPAKEQHTISQATAPASSFDTAAPPATTQPKAMSQRERDELTLREAFPGIEASVIKAVLLASGGQVEPAFNALLSMSDPEAANESAPPPQPPRPVAPVAPTAPTGPRSQLEADELYARQLAEHYQRQDSSRTARDPYQQQSRRPPQHGYQNVEERERNFIDDDLPEIGENIRKGFVETQQKFNGWLNNLKKKIDGEDEDAPPLPARRGGGMAAGWQSDSRRSGDYHRYDADPEEFDNDFSKLQLRDETVASSQPPRRANPDLFKPTPATPQDNGRRVSFQSGPPEEIRRSPDPTVRPSSTASRSKWQPLSTVDPSPVAEHDPFSLGDSDDEDMKKKDLKPDDSERLKNAMAELSSNDVGGNVGKKSEPQQTTAAGTKDVGAEKLTEKS